MAATSKEPATAVKEPSARRDGENDHNRPRRRKVERGGSDNRPVRPVQKQRTTSSAGEKVRHASDVTMPFLWRWASDTTDPFKRKPAKENGRPSGERKGSQASLGNRSDRRRPSEGVASSRDKGAKAATVTRDPRDRRPPATRSSSHPPLRSSTASSTRPPLHRSKTTYRVDGSATDSPRVNKSKRPHKVEAPAKKKRPASVLGTPLKPKKPVKMAKCVSCMDDVPAKKGVYLKYCQHTWCETCIKDVFELSVKDIQQMPPKCCKGKPIQPIAVNHLFDSAFRTAWNNKYQEWSAKDRLYCTRKSCGTWIKPEHIKTDAKTGTKLYGACPKCSKKVCPKCSGPYHPSTPDCPKDPALDDFIKMAKENGWQPCPKCGITVEKTEGCNHMTCPPPCKHQFCIICATKWKNCTCPWFSQEEIDRQRQLAGLDTVYPAPQTYAEEMAQRAAQEAADEDFARRMEAMGLDENGREPGQEGYSEPNNPPPPQHQQAQQQAQPRPNPFHYQQRPQPHPQPRPQTSEAHQQAIRSWQAGNIRPPSPRPWMPLREDLSYNPMYDEDMGIEFLHWATHLDRGVWDQLEYPFGKMGAEVPPDGGGMPQAPEVPGGFGGRNMGGMGAGMGGGMGGEWGEGMGGGGMGGGGMGDGAWGDGGWGRATAGNGGWGGPPGGW